MRSPLAVSREAPCVRRVAGVIKMENSYRREWSARFWGGRGVGGHADADPMRINAAPPIMEKCGMTCHLP